VRTQGKLFLIRYSSIIFFLLYEILQIKFLQYHLFKKKLQLQNLHLNEMQHYLLRFIVHNGATVSSCVSNLINILKFILLFTICVADKDEMLKKTQAGKREKV
jgi:hypothetical protein